MSAEDVFNGNVCCRVDALYEGVDDSSKIDAALETLKGIEKTLQEFRLEIAENEISRMLAVQLATQYSKIAGIFVDLENYFNDTKGGRDAAFDDGDVKKKIDNMHLILNGFVDMAKEVDRQNK